MPPFPANYRADILAQWKQHLKQSNIFFTEPFMLSTAFSDPVSIRKWHLHGISPSTKPSQLLINFIFIRAVA